MSIYIIHHPSWSRDLIDALEATGTDVVLVPGEIGKVEGFKITSAYVDELQQSPVGQYRPTHKGKVIAQWKSESRGRRS